MRKDDYKPGLRVRIISNPCTTRLIRSGVTEGEMIREAKKRKGKAAGWHYFCHVVWDGSAKAERKSLCCLELEPVSEQQDQQLTA